MDITIVDGSKKTDEREKVSAEFAVFFENTSAGTALLKGMQDAATEKHPEQDLSEAMRVLLGRGRLEQPDMHLPVAVEGQRQHCKQVSFDVRELAKSKGPEYEREIEQDVMIAGSPQQPAGMRVDTETHGDASERAMGSHVTARQPPSSFDARCNPTCFTEFFYGNCAPNLARQTPLSFSQVFSN